MTTRTLVRSRTSPIIELTIAGQKLGTTDEHPFYVPAREAFVPARELKAGDQLVSHAGRLLAIAAIRVTDQIANVYNMRVADYHTYFVGGAEWGWDVWAHNARCTPDFDEQAANAFFSKVAAGEPVVLKGSGGQGKVYFMEAERQTSRKPYIGSTKREVGTKRKGRDRMEDADHRDKTVDKNAPSARVIADDLTPAEKLGIEGILVHIGGNSLSNSQKAIRLDEVKNQSRVAAGNRLISEWFKNSQKT